MAEQHSSERWRPVVGYEGWYEVSDGGRVKRVVTQFGRRVNRVLRLSRRRDGYLAATLCRNCTARAFSAHRLVLAAFVGPCPAGRQVNHKNGAKSDNRLGNLEYVTPCENAQHAKLVLGQTNAGEKHPLAKLTDRAVRDIRRRYRRGIVTYKALATEYGVTPRVLKCVVDRTTWRHVT